MMNGDMAAQAFAAWQKGEAGQGYDDFKQLISRSGFRYCSHPLIGYYQGEVGLDKLLGLIKDREVKPNRLQFTHIVSYRNADGACFQFDSKGILGDGTVYEGYNIIQVAIEKDKLVGFREYFGYIDPSWFK
jgi:hypothetical protein